MTPKALFSESVQGNDTSVVDDSQHKLRAED